MIVKRPMKGEKVDDFTKITFPVLASPKYDGFRCLKLDGKCLSSSLKPIRNVYTREQIEATFPDGVDGELVLANEDEFNKVSSAFSAFDGEPDFIFYAFDLLSDEPFQDRQEKLELVIEVANLPRLKLIKQTLINSIDELEDYEALVLDMGFEGVMIRSLDGPYKCGKATVKQGWLLKIKRFEDSEAEILGFEEQMHNKNEKKTNELGLSKRSSSKENKVPAGTLGKFLVKDITTGVEFKVGTGDGLTLELRQEVWDNQEKYMGELIKYKFQKHGTKDKPRSPVWLGFRPTEDMS